MLCYEVSFWLTSFFHSPVLTLPFLFESWYFELWFSILSGGFKWVWVSTYRNVLYFLFWFSWFISICFNFNNFSAVDKIFYLLTCQIEFTVQFCLLLAVEGKDLSYEWTQEKLIIKVFIWLSKPLLVICWNWREMTGEAKHIWRF